MFCRLVDGFANIYYVGLLARIAPAPDIETVRGIGEWIQFIANRYVICVNSFRSLSYSFPPNHFFCFCGPKIYFFLVKMHFGFYINNIFSYLTFF